MHFVLFLAYSCAEVRTKLKNEYLSSHGQTLLGNWLPKVQFYTHYALCESRARAAAH